MSMDMNQMLKQVQQMQAEMERLQAEAAAEVVEASAGGGMVTVKANGAREIVSIAIKPEAIDSADPEMLEDLVVAATNEALRAAQDLASTKLGGATGLILTYMSGASEWVVFGLAGESSGMSNCATGPRAGQSAGDWPVVHNQSVWRNCITLSLGWYLVCLMLGG